MLKVHVSHDGNVRAASGDVTGWIFHTWGEELKAWEVEHLWQASVQIMGRRLYEEMAAYWPGSEEPYARPMNEIPKLVLPRTLERPDWAHARVSRADVAEEIAPLRREAGKDIRVHGRAAFAPLVSRLGLVDE